MTWDRRTVVGGLGAAAAAAATWTLPAGPAGAAPDAEPSFFDSVEVRSDNMKPFKKWRGALKRYAGEAKTRTREGSCEEKEFNACHYRDWTALLERIKDLPELDQIAAVNGHMNEAPYITDMDNWGVKDYWESPGEFMARFGDCEDYAIAKFMSFMRLGYDETTLRVAAVKDLNLKVGHAVLVILRGDRPLLLDNQIRQVVATTSVRHYEPVFSINTQFWWRHRKA